MTFSSNRPPVFLFLAANVLPLSIFLNLQPKTYNAVDAIAESLLRLAYGGPTANIVICGGSSFLARKAHAAESY